MKKVELRKYSWLNVTKSGFEWLYIDEGGLWYADLHIRIEIETDMSEEDILNVENTQDITFSKEAYNNSDWMEYGCTALRIDFNSTTSRESQIASALNAHPEGIIVHFYASASKQHSIVFVSDRGTGYEFANRFYVCDAAATTTSKGYNVLFGNSASSSWALSQASYIEVFN